MLEERLKPENKVSSALNWISKGPLAHVLKYSTFIVNGHRFSTNARDASRVTQNSGVTLLARTPQISSSKDQNPIVTDMSFYGVLVEIWVLDYVAFKVPMFKCDWVDSKNGVKTDDMGHTLVDLGRIGHKSDSFIFASQAKQVFYVPDQVDPSLSVVLESRQNYQDYGGEDDLNDILEQVEVMPSVESFDATDESQSNYMREDCEGIWVDR